MSEAILTESGRSQLIAFRKWNHQTGTIYHSKGLM